MCAHIIKFRIQLFWNKVPITLKYLFLSTVFIFVSYITISKITESTHLKHIKYIVENKK